MFLHMKLDGIIEGFLHFAVADVKDRTYTSINLNYLRAS